MSMLPVALRKRLPGWRADAPEAFLLDGRRSDTRALVVCAGDSITHGQVSANYVGRLDCRLRPAGYQLVNGGVNGDLAFNVNKRLDKIIACRPDVVTLLVGTNDINSRFDGVWEQRHRKNQRLPVAPSLDFYLENIEAILSRLQGESGARVALIEIPPLGEDLSLRMNGLVRDYNAALHKVAVRRGLPCLPLYTRLVALMPEGHRPPPTKVTSPSSCWRGCRPCSLVEAGMRSPAETVLRCSRITSTSMIERPMSWRSWLATLSKPFPRVGDLQGYQTSQRKLDMIGGWPMRVRMQRRS